jgi:hypothetical protein
VYTTYYRAFGWGDRTYWKVSRADIWTEVRISAIPDGINGSESKSNIISANVRSIWNVLRTTYYIKRFIPAFWTVITNRHITRKRFTSEIWSFHGGWYFKSRSSGSWRRLVTLRRKERVTYLDVLRQSEGHFCTFFFKLVHKSLNVTDSGFRPRISEVIYARQNSVVAF